MVISRWTNTRNLKPPQNVVVEVLSSDNKTISRLIWDGRLWWTTDKKMYVYWNPQYWRTV